MSKQDARRYKFGFVLTTAAGNRTRFLNLQKYAQRDPEVECIWAPVSHYMEPNPFHRWPGPLRTRLVVWRQSQPVIGQLSRLDAVMYHVFEPYLWAVMRQPLRGRPRIVWSQDNPPLADSTALGYGGTWARAPWRARLRFAFDRWCLTRVTLCLPFSHWAADALTEACAVPRERVHPVHVGLDLELWPHRPKDPAATRGPAQILFVGGDFVRKGGTLLLDVFARRFGGRAELHLVTQSPPATLPSGVTVHTGLGPNAPRLRELYARADLFVLPTRADVSSWVALEAMATGLPVIASRVGGIPDIVRDGATGYLIEPGDGEQLAERMEALIRDSALRHRMGLEGRRHVECDFDAARNVPRILTLMKQAVQP